MSRKKLCAWGSPRLPFGLPGVNKKDKIGNGNYVWISYFYSYLNERGRTGFVMSSQASSAGGGEARVRQKLVETGDVEAMIAIRSNFFYTRTVPCELWFLDRAKQEKHRNKVLMIDARHLYRKVTRKIYDFSPEQHKCEVRSLKGETASAKNLKKELVQEMQRFASDIGQFSQSAQAATADFEASTSHCKPRASHFKLQESSSALVQQADRLCKLAARLIETCEKECDAKSGAAWSGRDVTRARKAADEARRQAVEPLKQVRYFWRQAHWLTERFPEAELRDVAGLVKLVDRAEIEANDWSLTPGRYVGVAPEEEDADFDFEEALREIHLRIEKLNTEAVTLATTIKKNFEELGI